MPEGRPAVSVLVPFAGGAQAAAEMATALSALELRSDDEGVVADNSPSGTLRGLELPPGWRVVEAVREGSPAHARNTAALDSSRDWLLFLDSDVQPPATLLDDFFREPIPEDMGIVGGRVLSDESQRSLAARWASSRGMTTQESNLEHPFRPYLLSACMLIRRSAWLELGGFYEGIFNGEDVDFCWRAQEAGWKLQLCSRPAVVHVHRETVEALMTQAGIRGASATWVHRRWPNATKPRRPGPLLMIKGIVVSPLILIAGQAERAGLRLLDVAIQLAESRGTLRDNRARERPAAAPTVELWCDEFPLADADPVVAEARRLADEGRAVSVVAGRRPDRPALGVHDVRVRYLEDETALERWRALLTLLVRRPVACLRARGADLRVLAPAIVRLLGRPDVSVQAVTSDAAPIAERAARLAGL